MALRDHNVINTNMSNRMLKFKTEVPKCQGVKLLKYKLCFNIPKHYTKYAWVHKKLDARQCLIFQSNVTDRTSRGDSLTAAAMVVMWNSESPTGLMTGFGMPPCYPQHGLQPPPFRKLKDVDWENKTVANYHLIRLISLASVERALCCLDIWLYDL